MSTYPYTDSSDYNCAYNAGKDAINDSNVVSNTESLVVSAQNIEDQVDNIAIDIASIKTTNTTPTVAIIGNAAVGASAAQITSTITPLVYGVTITALAGNTTPIYVGGSNTDATHGDEINPGNSKFYETTDLNTYYIYGTTSTDRYSYKAV